MLVKKRMEGGVLFLATSAMFAIGCNQRLTVAPRVGIEFQRKSLICTLIFCLKQVTPKIPCDEWAATVAADTRCDEMD